jgi:Recombination directionality factor-like
MNPRLNKERSSMPVATVGHVKIGMKNEKGYPTSLDHFIATSNHKTYVDMFNDSLGEKPNILSIIFISDNVSDVCSESMELRDKSGALFCKSDGEIYRVVKNGSWVDYHASEMIEKYGSIELFESAMVKASGGKEFKRKLTLRFVITQIKGLFGQWQFTTYADKSSIDQIINAFDNVKFAAGTVKMIPFDLTVTKVKKDMSGSANKYPVINLVANSSFESLNKLAELGESAFNKGILTEEKILQLGNGINN